MAYFAPLLVLGTALSADPTQPHYPHYGGSRKVQVLDSPTEWKFGFYNWTDFGDATRDLTAAQLKAIATTEAVTVPSVFDNEQPGVLGRRGTAFYRRTFTDLVPNVGAQRIWIGACSFYCRVFVDGKAYGEHRASGYTPFWIDIDVDGDLNRNLNRSARSSNTNTNTSTTTPHATTRKTTHELLIMADNRYNHTTAPCHTGGDFYEFGGLTRSVILHQVPAATAATAAATATADATTTAATATTAAVPTFIKSVSVMTASADLTSVNLTVMFGGSFNGESITVAFNGASAPTITVPITDAMLVLTNIKVSAKGDAEPPKPWTAAHPNLHTVKVVTSKSGDAVTARFGLRYLSINAGGRLLINGVATKLKGYNRHTMSPMSGSALTLKEVQKDVDLLVEVGANFVRGAHYPQDQRFLDLCDEKGIMVWEETLGPNTGTNNMVDPYFVKYQVQSVHEMVAASASHPSVIMHAFYNEGPDDDPRACAGYNASAEAIRDAVPLSHRMVTWASSSKEKGACYGIADILSFNDYPGWYTASLPQIEEVWRNHTDWVHAHYPSKPFIASETGAGAIYEWKNTSKSGGHAPKWSQEYQAEIVTADVSAVLGNERASGIAVWQFNDVKADPSDFHPQPPGPTKQECLACDYSTPYNPTTPMECSYISTTSCFRPGGENHKGAVDFWRRKKAGFIAAQKCFTKGC